MKKIILALALCLVPTLALADAPGPQCLPECSVPANCTLKLDCPPPVKKAVKKKKKKKTAVVVAPVPAPACAPTCPAPVVIVNPTPSVVVVKTVTRTVKVPAQCPDGKCKKEPKVVVGGYVALGVGVRDQYVQGNVGLQLEFPKARLGLRAFTALDKGVGFQALIYPYRSERVKVHILDPGVLITGDPFNYTNNTDVPRRVDLLLGAGVQVKLTCHLQLLVDWRVNIADPGMLARDNGVVQTSGAHAGQYLDSPHVVGNSFSSSQVMLGLLFHN